MSSDDKSSSTSGNDSHHNHNDSFYFDSNGKVTLEFFDAMEAIYIENLYEQQSSDDSPSVDSPSLQNELEEPTASSIAAPRSKRENLQRPSIVHNIKGRVDANQKKLRAMAHKQRTKLEAQVRARRKRLKQLLKDPKVVMTMDKISFTLGLLTIMLIEGVLLCAPDQMGLLYTTLLVPLMVARYIIYKAALFHYFMYDFCYFSQLLLLVHIYKYPQNETLAKAMFSICNGPIAGAVVMWRNSLVFHSMDKMTSMFIHLLPPIVMFCRRWGDHFSKKEFPFYEEMDGKVYANITEFWWNPFVYYAIWQTIYLIKTEWWSKQKLQYNPELMTSLRWLTHKKHSSSYKLLSYFGEQHQLATFVLIQAIYTFLTFLMMPLLWHSIWLHGAYLMTIFIIALANGAMYYFHVFAVRYIEEVGKQVSVE